MNALAGTRLTMQTLPLHPHVLLSGSERIMDGSFGIVTQNLLGLGSCPIQNLVNSPKADLEGFDLPFVFPDFDSLPSSSQPPEASLVFSDEKERASDSMQFVAKLHQTCIQSFGNSEALKFEFIEEDGPDNKQCILTISRPNGMSRSYTTEPEFSRKSDAKARAASIAVEMGAVDFILHGNKDASKSRSKLAPLDSNSTKQEGKAKEESPVPVPDLEGDEMSKQIQDCCIEWRAGQVRPRWLFFSEHKASSTFGCALIVELSPHQQRTYSISALYDSKLLAKRECSEAAIRQGVLDFIKFGNGQTAPAAAPVEPFDNANLGREPELEKKGRLSAISIQDFFDTLPKPFPEPIGDKAASNINAPGMLNTTLQLAKGARLSLQFYFINDNGLHGCIIRLQRPEETRTYVVDHKFSKRADAKAAVCLLAMSQGVSQYIRSVAAVVENRITPEMRKKANEQILPILGSEYAKLRHGMHPTYEFDHDQGAFGCTMALSLSADPRPEEIRKWTVKPEYRTKTDAKIAVVYLSGQEAIEFVRFRGESVPPDHDPFKPYKRIRDQPQSAEKLKKDEAVIGSTSRSAMDQRPNYIPKRPMTASGLVRLGLPSVPLLETKEEAMARQRAEQTRSYIDRSQQSRPPFRQSSFSRPPPAPSRSAPRHSYPPPPPRDGPPTHPRQAYNVSAVAAAVIDRVTSSSSTRSTPSPQHPPPPLPRPSQNSPPRAPSSHSPPQPPPHPSFGPPGPQRKPYNSHYPPYPPYSQHPHSQTPHQQNSQSVTARPPQSAHSAQPPLYPQQYSPYGTSSHPAQAQQHALYGANAYPAGYAQVAYPFPVQPSASFPPPPTTYAVPTTAVQPSPAHAYGVAAYSYPAYYADPRYAHYGIPMSYAVPVPTATAGFPYPPPPISAQPPAGSTQWSAPAALPSALPVPTSDGQTNVSGNITENGIDTVIAAPARTTSFSAGSDRQKRPRSREGSPEDAQQHKKQRSESALPPVHVKRESMSVSPSPPTPVSVASGPSSVEQLFQYCGAEGITWPEFGSKQMKNDQGEYVFKVWIIMGKERLELPSAFSTENEGRQRVAKQVLQRLRSQAGRR